jgi:hypothetical protein
MAVGEGAGVAFGLSAGLHHGVVPGSAATNRTVLWSAFLGREIDARLLHDAGGVGFRDAVGVLLRLEHESVAAVEVDPSVAEGPVPEGDLHRVLKGVAVGVGIRRTRHLQQIAQFAQEELGISPLRGLGTRPPLDEGVGGGGRVHGGGGGIHGENGV